MRRNRTAARVALALVLVMSGLVAVSADTAGVARAQEPSATTSGRATPGPHPTDRKLIQFVNPSGHSDVISARADGSDSAYHLVAWSNYSSMSWQTEFRYRIAGSEQETLIARVAMSATYVYEHRWQPPAELAGRELVLTAVLFDGSTEVARDEANAFVAEPDGERSAAVEIVSPAHGAETWGVRTSRHGVTKGVVDVTLSSDAARVQVLYTLWPPGTHPLWEPCGTETAAEAADGVICTIDPEHAEPGQGIRAVAAVASGSSDPAAFEGSGDAHVFYGGASQHGPSDIDVTPDMQRAETGDCSAAMTVTFENSEGQPIIGATVEIHAWGPDDGLFLDEPGTTNALPEGHDVEAVRDCEGREDVQAEHEKEGPDVKHILSNGVTDDEGRWSFRVSSPTDGQTLIFIRQASSFQRHFCDEYEYREVHAVIGWDEEPVAPEQVEAEPDAECPVRDTQPTCTGCNHNTTSSTHNSTSSGGETVFVPTSVTIRFGDAGNLSGWVRSTEQRCRQYRYVAIRRRSDYKIVAEDRTDRRGRWKIAWPRRRTGRFYARVAGKQYTAGDRTIFCDGNRSRDIRIRR